MLRRGRALPLRRCSSSQQSLTCVSIRSNWASMPSGLPTGDEEDCEECEEEVAAEEQDEEEEDEEEDEDEKDSYSYSCSCSFRCRYN